MKIPFDTYGLNKTELKDCFFYFTTTTDGTKKLWDIDSRKLENSFGKRYSFEDIKSIKIFGIRDIKKGYGLKKYKTLSGFLKAVNNNLKNNF